MVLVKAGPAEILRSSQKDEFIVNKIQKLCEDVFLSVLGPRLMIKYQSVAQVIGQLLYYGNTTLSGLQTLGEEYTGILQVDDSLVSVPSLLSRFLMVILNCFGSQLANFFLLELEKNVKQNKNLNFESKKKIVFWISIMKKVFPSIVLFHKAVFYCNWRTYHISKRISGINYILIRYWLRDKKSLFGFRILGAITLVNFFLHSIQSLSDLEKKESTSESYETLETCSIYSTGPAKKCVMCLNKLKNPTATMCGHVYCWICINECLRNQEICPVCRENIHPSRLIPLHNYN